MQRITITLDDDLLAELDRLIAARGYANRSRAIRDLARAGIRQALLEASDAPACVAALVYVQELGARGLAHRLTALFHDHHDLSVATLQVPLGHESGLNVAVLKGPTAEVRDLADAVLTARGVAHGRAVIVPAELDAGEHRHGEGAAAAHGHVRTR
jgi:CopG family nickel-responsive transcriptional regulator